MESKLIKAIATQNMAGVVSIGDQIEIENIYFSKNTPVMAYDWFDSGPRIEIAIHKKGELKNTVIHNRTTNKSFDRMTFGYTPLSEWLRKK